MKTFLQNAVLITLIVSNASSFGRGLRTEASRNTKARQPEIVDWVGEVKDDPASHNSDHDHDLEFVKKDDGESYDIVDSPELLNLHHTTGKNYLVRMEAEKTPRFLFWGGNLIVRKFDVLEETSESLPHQTVVRTYTKPNPSDRR